MDWESFYNSHSSPASYEIIITEIKQFISHHENKKIVLITSGGTTVPIEQNTVRFVDNFSAGTRGSASAEYFLDSDYAVIFLYRSKSLEPFLRHFLNSKLLDKLEIVNNKSIQVKEDLENLIPVLKKYKDAKSSNNIISIPFTTLVEYMWLLRGFCKLLNNRYCLIYLAAAVSDFYIPPNEMAEHKIQSKDGPPVIALRMVPKVLMAITQIWSPKAFIVSFKLETDNSLLESKSKDALIKYKHQLVIGNLLHTRKYHVKLICQNEIEDIYLSEKDNKDGIEIEDIIVKKIKIRHEVFLKMN
ncbi:uncharacterized protein LOC126905943 isoform X2 [Daktulosphaira vitifoliae]|uniref:uncharacterized protein LOC126905943 isoform X2 n=1 Tax=Daktulosphaira vitifoliae TaxID=58002 RepID=UPI0021AA7935|nr:uncharacterized protein LOC126905943 isoform X2 [Daktulosphaira vitifoliae]